MGLYSDLQNDIIEAFNNDLLDATRTIQVKVITGETYDEITMKNVPVSISKDVRAVKLDDEEDEIIDSSSNLNMSKFLIMDYDKITSGIEFELEQEIIDGNDSYKIKGISQDPAKASWILTCRIWG